MPATTDKWRTAYFYVSKNDNENALPIVNAATALGVFVCWSACGDYLRAFDAGSKVAALRNATRNIPVSFRLET